MARSKNKRNSKASATSLSVARPIGLPRLSTLPSVTLRTYEDRRTFYPEPYTRPAFALPRSAARLVTKPVVHSPSFGPAPARGTPTLPAGVSFAVPERVAICVRRKRRKEVLHALNKAGGSGKQKRRRNTRFSGVSC